MEVIQPGLKHPIPRLKHPKDAMLITSLNIIEQSDVDLGSCQFTCRVSRMPTAGCFTPVPAAIPFTRLNGDKRIWVSMFLIRLWEQRFYPDGCPYYDVHLVSTGDPEIIKTPIPFTIDLWQPTQMFPA